ncbi:hypothetical protein ACP70R_042267 [Stipagrostis hirtigluma subsp. patula]
MSSRVRVLNVTHVRPAQTGGESSPPRHGEHKLSFLDLIQIARIPIQRLFLYDGPNLPPFPSIVAILQPSLVATLAVYLPLAGRLVFRPISGDVVVDCSPDAVSSGVRFVEAEFCGDANEMRRLARDEEHDTEAFLQLVPDIEGSHQLPSPVLAVQVTRPSGGDGAGGAVALGVSILHAVADGHAVWQFVKAWSAAAREGSVAAAGLPAPTFDRAGIRHPEADELARSMQRMFAPALPLVKSASSPSTVDTTEQSRRTFVLRADDVRSLKQHILEQSRVVNDGEPSKPPTTYVAVSSLVWTSIVRAKPTLRDADDAHFMVSADCRRRVRPPLGDGFFGNCVIPCWARARAGDLRGGGALARAAAAIQDGIREYLEEPAGEDPVLGFERGMAVYRSIPPGSLTAVGSSHRFPAYGTDFGWGAPSRVELVSVFGRELVTLLGGRDEGSVQVSVALDRAAMDAFAANFVVPAASS